MNLELPHRPSRVTREQSREAKQREKLFHARLKAASKASGWRYASKGIFRQQGDWFASVLPTLLWGRGVTLRLMVKPMSVDPLFWKIEGLEDNNRLPLSFRANGAWVLRAPSVTANIALGESDPAKLADEVVSWASSQTATTEAFSVEKMILQLEGLQHRRHHFSALEICLRVQLGDLDGALDVCGRVPVHRSRGFGTLGPDGSISTFSDKARPWIIRARGVERT
jgi:hypothetical protein